jgi:hypothetical protein
MPRVLVDAFDESQAAAGDRDERLAPVEWKALAAIAPMMWPHLRFYA